MVVRGFKNRRMGHCTYCDTHMTATELRDSYDNLNEPIHMHCYISRARIDDEVKDSMPPAVMQLPINLDHKIANLQIAVEGEKPDLNKKKVKENSFPAFA